MVILLLTMYMIESQLIATRLNLINIRNISAK